MNRENPIEEVQLNHTNRKSLVKKFRIGLQIIPRRDCNLIIYRKLPAFLSKNSRKRRSNHQPENSYTSSRKLCKMKFHYHPAYNELWSTRQDQQLIRSTNLIEHPHPLFEGFFIVQNNSQVASPTAILPDLEKEAHLDV